ncbi:hypothetical protein D8674_036698 [Pyrus ussuriensis x Pyrus communis]|uniref:Uncharacterized protein n=1 Tax=Pyrus ussuriensis x Pyrus communis TaxID=2448454 RepID=A0A5N5I917_9ROSA|nr:hypothetical protein D8674_036698 [Pyrus ussuriensis x Pyrus communis]
MAVLLNAILSAWEQKQRPRVWNPRSITVIVEAESEQSYGGIDEGNLPIEVGDVFQLPNLGRGVPTRTSGP